MRFKLWFEATNDPQWQKFSRQKYFPFMRDMETPFYRNAKSFLGRDVEDMGLDDSGYEPGQLYHVTTNLKGVKASERLKSRAELGGQGIGLGGGPSNMAPGAVSLTYNYGKALEIYEGLKLVADIIAGKTVASAIYTYAMDHSDNRHFDMGDEDELSATDEVLIGYGVPKRFVLDGDEQKIKAILDRKVVTPQARYEFLQAMERAVLDDNPSEDYSDTMQFDPVVGFTAPFRSIQGLDPTNIAIIQVVIRKSAQTSHYSQEAELRVDPQDLAIVRYLQP